MKNGLEGSDFMYLAIAGVIGYAAYRVFRPGGVFGDDITPSVIAPVPFTTPVSGTGKSGSIFDFSAPSDYKIGQLPTVKQALVAASPVGSFETAYTAVKELFTKSTPSRSYIDPYIPGAPNFSTPQGAIFVDTSGKAPNFSSASGKAVYVPSPSTPTGKPMYSTQSSSRVTGAPVGTRFASGAVVKSVGASGKYNIF